jgi:hypothetical protein
MKKVIKTSNNITKTGISNLRTKVLDELCKLSEKQLQAKIIEPLLRSLGFTNVRDNSGPNEKGKDLIAISKSITGKNELCAIQIKKIKLNASANSNNSFGNLIVQLQQARDEVVLDPLTNKKRAPDKCIFITPYSIPMVAWDNYLGGYNRLETQNVEIIDGNKLIELLQCKSPEVLEQFSLEVNYRLCMNKHLNIIPESILAFNLNHQLEIEKIYVDASICRFYEKFDRFIFLPVKIKKDIILIPKEDLEKIKYHMEIWGIPNDALKTVPPYDGESEKNKYLRLLKRRNISEEEEREYLRLHVKPKNEMTPEESNIYYELNLKKVKFKDTVIMKIDIGSIQNKMLLDCLEVLGKLSKISCVKKSEDKFKIFKKYIQMKDKVVEFLSIDTIKEHFPLELEEDKKSKQDIPPCFLKENDLLSHDINFIIVGEPGSGKTTLLRKLARILSSDDEKKLPIFIPLALLNDYSRESIIRGCIHQLQSYGDAIRDNKSGQRTILEKMGQGEIHLFFDGLDEVSSKYENYLKTIFAISKDFPNCRIIISCRSTISLPPTNGFFELKVAPFTEFKLYEFLAKWFTSEPSAFIVVKKWLKENERMRKAATNPLVATLLCSQYNPSSELPSSEVELYENRFDLLLGKWEHSKGFAKLSKEHFKSYWKFLTELAFFAHRQKQRVLHFNDIIEFIGNVIILKSLPKPTALVSDCIKRGILANEGSWMFSFGHFTYQEFLCATKLSSDNDLPFIFSIIDDPWWDNTLKFYATIKDDLTSLIKYLMDNKCSKSGLVKVHNLAILTTYTDKFLMEDLRRYYN